MPTNDPAEQMPPEDIDNDAVWDLVKLSPGVKPTEGFADRVLAALDAEEPAADKVTTFAFGSRAHQLIAIAAVLIVAVIVTITLRQTPEDLELTTTPAAEVEDVHELAEMELLLAAIDHPDSVTDDQLADLLY